jgi:hypothetical protein
VHGEDDRPAKASANVTTISGLLEPTWLAGNEAGIDFLTECFGFDELDLRLLGIAPEVQGRVRQGLAKLIESGGADPEFYEALVREVEAKQQRQIDVRRCRRLGYAVQDAVRQGLEANGLSVTLVDYGFDFEVTAPTEDGFIESAAAHFAIGPYFVEVKATTVGAVRLTPTQADRAASEAARYVLCVVDLRGFSDDELDQDWTGDSIAPYVSMLSDIGNSVVGTYGLVQRAINSEVGIRNQAALRYEVAARLWDTGIRIHDWVGAISSDPEFN